MVEVAESRVLHCPDLASLSDVSRQILLFSGASKIIIFKGNLGAGKTTLIQHICNELQVVDNVSSPTFSIVNEYLTESDETVYHFDFYRIKNVEEAVDIGLDEYVFSDSYCLMEWPEKIESLLPAHLEIIITPGERQVRTFELIKHG